MQIARQQQLTWPLGRCQQASLQQPTGAINAIPTALSAKAFGQVLLGLGNSAVALQRTSDLRQLRQVPRPGQRNSRRRPSSTAAVGRQMQKHTAATRCLGKGLLQWPAGWAQQPRRLERSF